MVFRSLCRSPGAGCCWPAAARPAAFHRRPPPLPPRAATRCRATSRRRSGRPIPRRSCRPSSTGSGSGWSARPACPAATASSSSTSRWPMPTPCRAGYVFVTRGLLALMDDEAELAAAMGHELGHITERHAAQRERQRRRRDGCRGRRGDEERLGHGRPLGGARRAAEAAPLFARPGARGRSGRRRLHHARRLSRRRHDHPDREAAAPDPARGSVAMGQRRATAASRARCRPIRRPTIGWPRCAAWPAAGTPGESGRAGYLAAIDGMSVDDPPEEGFVRGPTFLHPTMRIAFSAAARFQAVQRP